MVQVRGFGRTDRELRDLDLTLGATGRDDRGLLHDDVQIGILSAHLNFPNASEVPDQVRSRLDFIRGFLIKGRLQDAQIPAQRERNAAMAVLLNCANAFQAAMNVLTPLPNWPLVDLPQTEDLTPSQIFLTLPARLRLLAAMARAVSRDCAGNTVDTDSRASLLLSTAVSADHLADTLLGLDFASRVDVQSHLPWGSDYAMNTVSEVLGMSNRLSAAVEQALKAGCRSRGPRPTRELKQAIFWLRQVFEECGGRFTHTPRHRTHYDGRPHSAAGQFIHTFINMCDKTIRPQTISSAMAEVVKRQPRRPALLLKAHI